MTGLAGKTFGLLGALAAFPQRHVAREVERRGARLVRGVSRRASLVVVGRKLLAKDPRAVERLLGTDANAGRQLISENGFLRRLGLLRAQGEGGGLSRQALIDQSRLAGRVLDLLSLFDAFECDGEPYSFRDLILARKYAGLVSGGAEWSDIARAIHRCGDVASLTAKSLAIEGGAVYARQGEGLSELNGQMLLGLDGACETDADEAFAAAEEAEAGEAYEDAVALYGRCLAIDPRDAVAAFNRANCLTALGRPAEAEQDYLRAARLDPGFAEAWFNLAGLVADGGRAESARRHLATAIALDPDYADAIFNLARLEYEGGNLPAARHWWARYLELDSSSEWATTARRGIRYIDLSLAQKSAG